tara:strand:- start:5092 stop:5262 length:171 start_codon:yes stop_codon:yes gene_type:complete
MHEASLIEVREQPHVDQAWTFGPQGDELFRSADAQSLHPRLLPDERIWVDDHVHLA